MPEVAVSWTNEADQDLGLPKFETDGAAGARKTSPPPSLVFPLTTKKEIMIAP